jgi:hypothetical protein
MDLIYQKIVQTTKNKRSELPSRHESVEVPDLTESELLERHIVELFDIITDAFEDNVSAAADRGACVAIICIYHINSKHRGIIPIHDMLMPHEHLSNKLRDHNITPLLERLQIKFNPFKICCKSLADAVSLDIGDATRCIVVTWDIETPELVA